jgi:hypothetical protein
MELSVVAAWALWTICVVLIAILVRPSQILLPISTLFACLLDYIRQTTFTNNFLAIMTFFDVERNPLTDETCYVVFDVLNTSWHF